ncbi:MAG: C40 family peptidase, partial [Lachnospiraceae bacterium]|nr:C40 family peptidase [Lachnospiraceae bacterium]
GELQYTDDEGEVSTFSSASLYKAIVIMATIATQNDVTIKNVDDAYYRYCQKLLDTAFTSGTGYEVNYHSQALTGTARDGEGYSWDENGTTFTADRVVLTADITVYVGCYLEDLMDSDESDAESMKKLGFVNSTFEGWTKENRDLAWTYMKLDDESFQKLFNVTFPYGLSMSGNVWGYIEEALRMAADNSIGYDWGTRCLNPNVDCSSFVYYSLKKAGFDMGLSYPFTTSGMGTVLQNLGFVKIPIRSAMPLMEGDILWWDGAGYLGHTEIYIGNNQMVGAHGKNGIAKPDQVSICTYSQGSFTHVFRLSVPACNYDFFGKTDASQSPGVQAVQSCINYYEAGLRKLNSSGKKMQYSNHGWASNYFRRFDKLLASRDRDPAGRIYYSANCDSGHIWVQQDLLSPSQGYYQVSGIWNDVTASVMKGGSKSFRYLVDSNLLQPGDLIVFKTHRFIYYGKGLVFDTGHGSKWYRDGSISHTDKYKAVFRSFLIPVRNSSDYTRDGTFRVKRVKAGFIPRYYRSASGLLVPIRKLEDND